MVLFHGYNIIKFWSDVTQSVVIDIVILFLSYLFGTIILFFITRLFHNWRSCKYDINEYQSLKYNFTVFKSLLSSEPHLSSGPPYALVFGNSKSKDVITVISNPFCISCVANHLRLDRLPLDKYKIQYVFTSFSEDLLYANCYFIAFYEKFGAKKTWQLLTEWYESQNKNMDFFKMYDLEHKRYENVVMSQLIWVSNEKIEVTPAIYLNGIRLPSIYNAADITFFI